VDLENGFRWLRKTWETQGDLAVANGGYLFPEFHRSPTGTRVIRGCAGWICQSDYPMTDNLWVFFEFWNIIPYSDWVEHDCEVQRVLKSLQVEQE
jgi:hypothetical protein